MELRLSQSLFHELFLMMGFRLSWNLSQTFLSHDGIQAITEPFTNFFSHDGIQAITEPFHEFLFLVMELRLYRGLSTNFYDETSQDTYFGGRHFSYISQRVFT
jgi:hypothetical protein